MFCIFPSCYLISLSSRAVFANVALVTVETTSLAAAIALGLIVLLVGSNAWVSRSLVRSLEWQNIHQLNFPMQKLILAVQQKPTAPSVDLSEEGDRILYGAQLYRQRKPPNNCCRWSH